MTLQQISRLWTVELRVFKKWYLHWYHWLCSHSRCLILNWNVHLKAAYLTLVDKIRPGTLRRSHIRASPFTDINVHPLSTTILLDATNWRLCMFKLSTKHTPNSKKSPATALVRCQLSVPLSEWPRTHTISSVTPSVSQPSKPDMYQSIP